MTSNIDSNLNKMEQQTTRSNNTQRGHDSVDRTALAASIADLSIHGGFDVITSSNSAVAEDQVASSEPSSSTTNRFIEKVISDNNSRQSPSQANEIVQRRLSKPNDHDLHKSSAKDISSIIGELSSFGDSDLISNISGEEEVTSNELNEQLRSESSAPSVRPTHTQLSEQLRSDASEISAATALSVEKRRLASVKELHPNQQVALEVFLSMTKLKEFDKNKVWKYPEGQEWVIKITNVEHYYYDYTEETIVFEWVDAKFQRDHQQLQKELFESYFQLRNIPQANMELKDYAYDTAAIIDLGEDEGFYRCAIGTLPEDLDDPIVVRLFDKGVCCVARCDQIYPCLIQFGLLEAKTNDLHLYQLTLYSEVDVCRQEVYKYFTLNNKDTKYLAHVIEINKYNVAIVDLYTLDSPAVYVNYMILANIVNNLPGPELPPVGQTMDDIFVSHAYKNGTIAIQVNTFENYCFFDVLERYGNDRIIELRNNGPYKLDKSTVYLAKYFVDEEYYRARVLELNPSDAQRARWEEQTYKYHDWCPPSAETENWILAYFIDYGNLALVDPSELVPTDLIDPVLGKFKDQAMLVKLANVKQLNVTYFRLRLPEDKEVTLQVLRAVSKKDDIMAAVEIFQHRDWDIPEQMGDTMIKDNQAELWDEPILVTENPYKVKFDTLERVLMEPLGWSLPPAEPLIIKPGINLLVVVSLVITPNHFIMRPYTPGKTDPWRTMEEGLGKVNEEEIEKMGILATAWDVFEHGFYSCKLETRHVRVRIAETPKKTKLNKVKVLLIDYAIYREVHMGDIQNLKFNNCALPPKSVVGSVPVKGKWSAEQKHVFKQNIEGKTICFHVLKVESDKYGLTTLTGELYSPEALTDSDSDVIPVDFDNLKVKDKKLDKKFKYKVSDPPVIHERIE